MKRVILLNPIFHPIFLVSFLTVISAVFTACEKRSCDPTGDVACEVAIYLLESYETLDQTCAINNTSVELKEQPFVAYSDIESYNPDKHIFTISDHAKETVKSLQYPVLGIPFAVVADNQLIYTGYFWPAYSSAICQWIVIDPLMIFGDNELRVELGYPGLMDDGPEIPDERNNPLILDIFKRDGKLIN